MTINFLKKFSCYLITCFSLTLTELKAESTNNIEKEKIVLTVAIEQIGYSPYNYEDDGEIKGFTIDILHYIETHSHYEFEYIILPWPRALYLVAQGKIDMILTLFKNKKREKIYHFIEPSYGYEINQLFTLVDNKFDFTGQLQQLTPYSIGTKREFSYGKAFDNAHYLTKLPALTEEILLKLLLAGRVDIAISNPFVFKKMLSQQNIKDQVIALEPYVALTPVFLALTMARKDSLEIKTTLGQIIQQLKKSPYYQELLTQYQLNFD